MKRGARGIRMTWGKAQGPGRVGCVGNITLRCMFILCGAWFCIALDLAVFPGEPSG